VPLEQHVRFSQDCPSFYIILSWRIAGKLRLRGHKSKALPSPRGKSTGLVSAHRIIFATQFFVTIGSLACDRESPWPSCFASPNMRLQFISTSMPLQTFPLGSTRLTTPKPRLPMFLSTWLRPSKRPDQIYSSTS
jgi:hypothetical protein